MWVLMIFRDFLGLLEWNKKDRKASFGQKDFF